jgi:uncharacterized protein YciI
MANFVVYALDKPDRETVRLEHRPAHRARLREHDHPVAVKVGRPLLDAKATMIGSLLIVEAETAAAVEDFVAGPYALADVYGSVDIHPFSGGLGNPAIGGLVDG